jgi:molecular chaperone DnaK (HSP70)
MIREAEENADADKKARELVEARNAVQNIKCGELRKTSRITAIV